MSAVGLSRAWSYVAGQPWIMVALCLGLAAFCITLVVLLMTRWGHQPLRKCLLLSLLAHGLFAGYATTVKLFSFTPRVREQIVKISLIDGPANTAAGDTAPAVVEGKTTRGHSALAEPRTEPVKAPKELTKPTAEKRPATEVKLSPPKPAPATAEPPKPPTAPPMATAKTLAATPAIALAKPPAAKTADARLPTVPNKNWAIAPVAPKYGAKVDPLANAIDTPKAATYEPTMPINVLRSPGAEEAILTRRAEPAAPTEGPLPTAVPNTYRLRLAADHLSAARAAGGNAETEAAVKAALQWFANNQGPDGRWSARQHGAGRGATPDGVARANAGLGADTGMTGLALLALLASGHTHQQGQYQEVVRRGCNFLISQQNERGSLAGSADPFAAMYSHAIATFALSEDYGMTGDRQIDTPVRRAIEYTLTAQDAFGGGWRYKPGDSGDTSQLGWQFMALKSADLAGIPLPQPTRQGIARYLNSVASGKHGGLAAYRPSQAPTRTMTAEAMVCWQFLGLAHDHPAAAEAADFLLEAVPDDGPANYYYWYYGTLATFQRRGEAWQKWNAAVATQLVKRQLKDGPTAGTWDPDSIWGGYGGRIYSTALATLCLEVYYRYLPLYGQDR